MENLANDHPSPLELQVQTSRVYAEIASKEFWLRDFDAARNAQQTAQLAYQKALELLPTSGDAETHDRLEKIRRAIEKNQKQLGL